MLVNFLLSHPGVCISSGETHKVFKPGTRFDQGWMRIKKRFLYDWPIRAAVGQDIFYPNLMGNRKNVPPYIKRYIDKILYEGRFIARIQSHNLYKSENVEYTDEELAECRLLSKGLNGVVFTVDMFREMYPDATYFAMVRNGLAVCEGRARRGYEPKQFAQDYQAIVEKMWELENEMPNYHIIKFEDMITRPLEIMEEIYQKSDLDLSSVTKIRLESKATMDSKGNHQLNKGFDRQVFWYDKADITQHIRPDVNTNQIKQMDPKIKNTFLSVAGDTMTKLGYATD